MDERIEAQRQKIASLQFLGSDASAAAKILKLLEDTKAEMRVQLRVLGDFARPHK